MGFIFQETWRTKSALSKSVNEKLCIVLWDPTKPIDFGNLICMTKKEAQKHQTIHPKDFINEYSKEQLDYIQERFMVEQKALQYR